MIVKKKLTRMGPIPWLQAVHTGYHMALVKVHAYEVVTRPRDPSVPHIGKRCESSVTRIFNR